MPNTSTTGYFQLAYALKEFAKQQLPTIEKQVNALIKRKEKDPEIIECLLDVLSWLVQMGAGKALHDRLYAYYETIKRDIKN